MGLAGRIHHGLRGHELDSKNQTITPNKDANQDEDDVKRAILHAHNRWLFAKDLLFRRLDDIVRVQKVVVKEGSSHYRVEWKDDNDGVCPIETRNYHANVSDLLVDHVNKNANNSSTSASPEVWINGVFYDTLTPMSLESILQKVKRIPSRKLCFKSLSSSDDQLSSIRIDRYFRGGLYHCDEVFDHIMDNLIALEDPVTIDDFTLIGSATLPDWIMGRLLTSRLYVQEQVNGNILFLRPLYKDDITTSDRRFELIQGEDDAKIDLVRQELERLRLLATLPSPYQSSARVLAEEGGEPGIVYSSDESLESERSRQHRRNRRKKFTL